ncbi:hypothetical protein DPEC_G00287850 [Dallia pectoralis]|uniref:Uncharacterized protein n=1 Tax=Dallia pectoralis TaxID=75939 RepID=A0ACC2FKD4_DALPE|nr:hypothetical protein DPEC_G00287850 [Dallia pectoralis]
MLRVLDVSWNPLERFSITADVFPNLENLNLSYCGRNGSMRWEVGDSAFLREISTLDLSGVQMSTDHMSMVLQNFTRSSLVALTLSDVWRKSSGSVGVLANTACHIPSLKVLRLANDNISVVHAELLQSCGQTKKLDLSENNIVELSESSFRSLKKLQYIRLNMNKLSSVPNATKNLRTLKTLDLSYNVIKSLECSDFATLTGLVKLFLYHNAIQRLDSCVFQDLKSLELLSLGDNTILTLNGAFTNGLLKLESLKLVDIGFFYFIFSTSLVLLTLMGSSIYHLLRWQMVYSYYLLLAYLYDTKQKNRRAAYQYDAFVSYNAHDEPWVLQELLPELEDRQGWRLCLHHRDFQPGKPIIENITDAIYGSRKTICVITRRYLESEWCSREIQVASFRLFDEQKDVLILVFLEEIPDQQLSPYHRMRRLLKKRTYLSWPRAGEHTGVFWQKLRVALETRSSPDDENPLLTGVERL